MQPPWKTVWRVLNMLEIQLPQGSLIPVLRIHTEVKAGTRTDICTPTFIAALLTSAERWEQLESSGNEWTNQMWVIHGMEQY